MNIVIFTDGACLGNPGPGGWAAIIATPDGRVKEMGSNDRATTNNRMELTAVISGLRAIRDLDGPVDLYTDSTYVIRGITQWIWGWRKRGWKTSGGEAVINQDLWEILSEILSGRAKGDKVHWHYSRGHVGTPGNERCDEIAVAFAKGKWVDLYDGPLLKYNVAIHDVPEDSSLPEMKPKQEKIKAHSYLSYLGGDVFRHRDWPSCERRVKGRSGAKFKKVMSAGDEKKILSAWGLPPNTKITDESK